MRAFDPDAHYRDLATGRIHHGAILLTHGLSDLSLDDYASALVHLVREE
jgi:alpha-galactosidase